MHEKFTVSRSFVANYLQRQSGGSVAASSIRGTVRPDAIASSVALDPVFSVTAAAPGVGFVGATVPAPVVMPIRPVVVMASAAPQAPSMSTGVTRAVTVVVSTSTVPAPVVRGAVTVAPTTVGVIATIPVPTVSTA